MTTSAQTRMPALKDYPYDKRVLPAILEDKAAAFGEAPFVVGDRTLSYAQLLHDVERCAGGLEVFGIAPGERVLWMLPNAVESVVLSMGISWMGAISVPINTAYRGDMLRYIIEDTDAAAVVVAAEYLEQFIEVAPTVSDMPCILVGETDLPDESLPFRSVTAWSEIAAGDRVHRADLDPGDLHAIMYTSGTTGSSKGVMVPYHCSYQYANPSGTRFLAAGDIVYVTLPLFHIGGQWAGVYAALLAGGQVVLKRKFSVRDFWSDVDRYGVTQTILLGVMAEFIWKQPTQPDDADHPLVRATIAPAPKEARQFEERFGLRISQGWGMTEVGCVTRPDQPYDPLTCGRVRDDLFEMILADENDQPVPPGTPGEALIRPKQPFVTMSGYWRKPEATVDAWRNLWLHSGDLLVETASGYVFVDRAKDCIRRRGENISALEVERGVLLHPDVQECAAIPVRTEHAEDEVKVVVAVRQGADLTAGELHEFLVPRLPAFMVPRYIEFVSELPKTETQKVRKDVLRGLGVGATTWDRDSHAA